MRRISADVVIALLLLMICGGLYIDTHFYETVPGAIIGSKIWPRVVTFFLGGLSVLYLIQSLRTKPVEDSTGKSTVAKWFSVNRNVVGCFFIYGLFLISLKWLGMLLGGMLFVFVTLTFLGERNAKSHLMNAVVAVVTIGCMWAIFTYGLGVILPQGEILPR